jgi:hypothetical protein
MGREMLRCAQHDSAVVLPRYRDARACRWADKSAVIGINLSHEERQEAG